MTKVTPPQLVGDRIRERREQLGMKPADLALAASCTISAVLQWESNKTKNLKLDNLFRIADALNVEPRWLATGKGPQEPLKQWEIKIEREEALALAELRKALPEWRRYVLSLAFQMTKHEQQRLFLDVMRQAVPDYRVEAAYGTPGKNDEG
jgi:transcriptional regulator with XRE-family HTH domain